MKKLKPTVKIALASTLAITSMSMAVESIQNSEKSSVKNINIQDTSAKNTSKMGIEGDNLKLDIKKIDGDTVRVSLDNISEIPKSLQFSIKLEGDIELKDGDNSIKDLIREEMKSRYGKTDDEVNSDVLIDYIYDEDENTIDILITSVDFLPKTGNKVDVLELDIVPKNKKVRATSVKYKVIPNKEEDYKYVSSENKLYNNSEVAFEDEYIYLGQALTIQSNNTYINVIEGDSIDLTMDSLNISVDNPVEGENYTLEVINKETGEVINKFQKDTPGLYELECSVTSSMGEKSNSLTIQVNVVLDNVTDLPVITRDNKPLANVTLNGGDIFNPLEGVSATDAKNRNVEVDFEIDKELNLDPEEDTTYLLTYTAVDIYGNKAEEKITLLVIANKAPVIKGVKDHIIEVGTHFDAKNGVTVEDEDKKIELKVDTNLDTNVPGKYKVSYSATDSKNKVGRAQCTVTVVDKNDNPSIPDVDNPSNPEPTNTPPVIKASDRELYVGEKFDPLDGVTAYDKEDGVLNSKLKVIVNNVNINIAGIYTVIYEVSDKKGVTVDKVITVTVKDKNVSNGNNNNNNNNNNNGGNNNNNGGNNNNGDSNSGNNSGGSSSGSDSNSDSTDSTDSEDNTKNATPIISAPKKTIYVGDKFNPLEGVIATDKEDGNITSKIKVVKNTVDTTKAGVYIVRYEVTDTTKAKTTATRIITVVDKNNNKNDILLSGAGNDVIVNSYPAPEIIISDVKNKFKVGDTIDLLEGITATDKEDGDLTKLIKVRGKVDTKTPGTYKIEYVVSDKDGNTTRVARIIIIEPNNFLRNVVIAGTTITGVCAGAFTLHKRRKNGLKIGNKKNSKSLKNLNKSGDTSENKEDNSVTDTPVNNEINKDENK